MTKKKIRLAIAATAILTVGTVMFISCNKEDELKVNSKSSTTIIEEKATGNPEIVIVEIKSGKKIDNPYGSGKICSGTRGTCVLFFGGLFTIDPMSFTPSEACSYATLEINDNTLKMTVYFGNATKEEQSAMLKDIEKGYYSISEDVSIEHEDLLKHWNMTNPIILTPGKYKIEDYDLKKSTISLTIPYKNIE